MKYFLVALIVLSLAATAAQAEKKKGLGASFHDQVVTTYNFLPRNLDEKGIDAKSKELDVFWEKVKVRGPFCFPSRNL